MTYEQTDPNAGHIIQPSCSYVCPSDYQVNYYVKIANPSEENCDNLNLGASYTVI